MRVRRFFLDSLGLLVPATGEKNYCRQRNKAPPQQDTGRKDVIPKSSDPIWWRQ